jgi:hypothetical protein
MFKPKLLAVALAAVLPVSPLPASAATDADLAALRAEFDQKLKEVQAAYEARLKEMEARLAPREAQSAPVSRTPPAASDMNPEVSLILQGRYHHADGDGHITGFLPTGHAHGGAKGFSLDETELILSANVDPYFLGYANFAFADEEVETEEAWVQTSALGNGFTVRAGRYLSGIGYVNEQHPHAWDFADQNLAYAAMLGGHYGQDGLQLKWLAPTPMFLEFGLEAGQGADWGDRNGLGSHAVYAHLGDDVGDSHSWRAGLSWLRAKADGREGHWDDDLDVEAETLYSGRSTYWIADFVWKWAPGGNPRYRNVKLQAEYVRRAEKGTLACADNSGDGGACAGGISDSYRARQSGWYAQGIWQFHPEWRVGYRYDRLDAGTVDFGAGFAGVLSQPDFTPRRHSLMLDYNPSEFSRLRLQFARDRAEQGLTDDQVTLQYLHSLGTHGAHKF